MPERALSRANGLLEMSTFAAIVLGSAAGTALYALWDERLPAIGLALTAVAVVGAAVSVGIPRVSPARDAAPLRWNPWAGLAAGVQRLASERTLWMTALGVAWFWFLGALLQMAVLAAGRQVMGLPDGGIAAMSACLAVGVGGGSLAAGRWSGDKVELGLVPFGSFGMGLGRAGPVLGDAVVSAGLRRRCCCWGLPAGCSPCRSTRCCSRSRRWGRKGRCSRSATC